VGGPFLLGRRLGGAKRSPPVPRLPLRLSRATLQTMSAHIKILSGGAMRALMVEVVPLFEHACGVKADIEFRLTSVLQKDIEDGAVFDVALLPRLELNELVRSRRIASGTTADVTRSAVGLCVRNGAPEPDIATVDGFKRALLAAHSIAYSDGPSGAYIGRLLQRLGIAEAVKPKTILTSRPVAELVVAGEAEIGLQQIVAIVPVKGAALVGALPSELQNVIIYAAGASASAQNLTAAQNFIAFMRSPEVTALIRAKGMEPG